MLLRARDPRASAKSQPRANRYRPPVGERSKIALALVALTVAVYAEIGTHEFVDYDDTKHIVAESRRRARVSAARAHGSRRSRGRTSATSSRSPTSRSSSIARCSGRAPAGTLSVNVALHAASAVLLSSRSRG